MKTYDIYAKQEGKWQRKGIQGEPTLPYYDGTVIIEKAESVLGLRKLSFPVDVSTVGSMTDENDIADIYNQYYCEFEPITLMGFVCVGVSAMWSYTDIMGDTEPAFIIRTDSGYMRCDLSFALENGIEGLVVNITYCNNKTMEKWLLANTEGVSV
jgi:hypothetical protein